MNGHPRARMNTILRQCEAPVKIFNLQASQHRFIGPSTWSIIAGQGSNMEKMSNTSIFLIFWGDFHIDPGGPGDHLGGSRTDPRA